MTNIDFIKKKFISNGLTVPIIQKQHIVYFNCGKNCDSCDARWDCDTFYGHRTPFIHFKDFKELRDKQPELFV